VFHAFPPAFLLLHAQLVRVAEQTVHELDCVELLCGWIIIGALLDITLQLLQDLNLFDPHHFDELVLLDGIIQP